MATEDWSCNALEALQLRLCEPPSLHLSTRPDKKRVPHFPKVNAFSTGRSKAGNATLSSEEQELVEPFAPSFVYPIFGEEETIFGYQGLNIDVCLFSSFEPGLTTELQLKSIFLTYSIVSHLEV